MINISVSVKNQMIGVHLKQILCGILVRVIMNVFMIIKAFKVDHYLDNKKRLCKKLLFGKLVLAFENRILNSTVISLDDKKTNM